MANLEISGLMKKYGEFTVLPPLKLTVESGSLTVIAGPSGCGKSTLLRIIAGLEPQCGGEIRMDGKRIDHLPPRERNIAMVFQNLALYPHLTAGENIAFPLRIQKIGKIETARQVQETAEILGIGGLLGRRPDQLSGGERQRVALGRAMVRKPRLFLLDEPLSSLDAKLREDLRHELLLLHRRLGITMLYVTHDQTEALTMADNIVVLDKGCLQQTGTPEVLYTKPTNRFVAGFIGTPPMNFLPGQLLWDGNNPLISIEGSSCRIIREDRRAINGMGGVIILGIRPEEIRLGQPDCASSQEGLLLEVLVKSTRLNGYQAVTEIETLSGSWQGLALAPAKSLQLQPGMKTCAFLPANELHYFDSASGKAI